MKSGIPGVFAFFLLSACVTQPVGDFGRKQESVFHDTILSTAGEYAAAARGEPVSSYRMTDDENELRNIAWDLVRPPGGGTFRADHYFTMQWTRLAARDWYDADANDFYLLLRNGGLRSHETYYEILIEQARADASHLPLFRDAAMRVGKADSARRAAFHALDADEAMRGEAEARIADNARLIAWVEESLHYRILAYRSALGRLMVELPSTKAVQAEASIDALEWEVRGSVGRSGNHKPSVRKNEAFKPQSKTPVK